MVKDDQPQSEGTSPPSRPLLKLAAVALTVVGVLAVTCLMMAAWRHQPSNKQTADDSTRLAVRQFEKWTRPDVVLVLSGQQYGYLQPCGCSEPQLGGLARRYNFIQKLLEVGWPVVAGDLGDIPQSSGPQRLLKYRYSMEALKRIGYTAVGIGENELRMPLIEAGGEYALNNPSPRLVVANLKAAKDKYPGMTEPWEVSSGQGGVPKVAFVGVVGPSVAGPFKGDPDTQFDDVDKALPAAVAQLAPQKPELLVLLYQGSPEEARTYAKRSAQQPNQLPIFPVILCLCKEEQAPIEPTVEGKSLVLMVGHKGRSVGVVGGYRTGNAAQPFSFRYELIELGPEYETPKGEGKNHRLHQLMEDYAREVKERNYLAMYPHEARHPLQVDFPEATYVGSGKCKECHSKAYKIWKAHPHADAYNTLVVKATRPSLRQYDGECVVCHVTGFEYKTGWVNEKDTPKLKDVGCESCHGPGSKHVEVEKDPNADPKVQDQLRAAVNPWKRNANNAAAVVLRINDMCRKCHDTDNSHDFKFEDYWDSKKKPRTAHPTHGG
jgi:hypothetical protein